MDCETVQVVNYNTQQVEKKYFLFSLRILLIKQLHLKSVFL